MDKTDGTSEMPEKPAEFVEALAKGLAILTSFDGQHPHMSLSEIAKRVDLSPAAVRRSLITLKTLGYVGQDGKSFFLKPKVMTFGSAFYAATGMGEVLQPELQDLVNQFGDASSVAVLQEREVLYIAHRSVQRARRATAMVGARYPAHATSLGRVLLAGLEPGRLEATFERLDPVALTSRTETDIGKLRHIIEEVRQQGFATTVDELDYGVTAIAVPIRDRDGAVVAALNSSGYSGMVTPETLQDERLVALQETSARITSLLTQYPALESMLS